jgi:predicted ATPase
MLFLGHVLWILGELNQSREMMDKALARVKLVNHVGTTVYAHNGSALLALWRRDTVKVGFYTETVVELSRTHNLPMFAAWGAFLEAWSRWQLSGGNAGLGEMRNGIAACRAQGNGLYLPLLMTALAEAEAHAGEFETALLTIQTAIAETELHGQRWFEAETRRIHGEILLRREPANTEAAEKVIGEALAIAQKQKARVFELRAATDLARVWRDQQKRKQAHDILAPACAWFSGDMNTPELHEAKALLSELKA